ncbi:Protein of unknown function [Rhizobiales bacterium GAS191]|jgi:hypothetical protein|nr:Protein of unknown function [Rhizobiales bacterium GAS113]SEE29760.1 Protein of unknown function [Rhizobiales bacterium GAS191]
MTLAQSVVDPPQTLVDIPMSTRLDVEHLCDFSIDFEPVQRFNTPRGMRMIYVVKHGVAEGPRLRGEFLKGGGDWIIVGPDRVATLDVRATLKTDDGELIFVTNTGRARLTPEISAKLATGALIRWDEMFTRSSPLFETGAEKYAWLNSTVTIAVNEFSLSHVNYRIYSVK